MRVPFKDRTEAGEQLGEALRAYRGRSDVTVLALPRGGLPVAWEAARILGVALDLMLVRKLGVPGHEELAMGAIATGGARVLNEDIVAGLGIGSETIEAVAEREQRELERRARAYRGDRPPVDIAGRCIILIDDGLATGATMRAAIAALRTLDPARIVVAVPVAPPKTVHRLQDEADEVVCLETPEPFWAIGYWYQAFSQIGDDEVEALLAQAWRTLPAGSAQNEGVNGDRRAEQ